MKIIRNGVKLELNSEEKKSLKKAIEILNAIYLVMSREDTDTAFFGDSGIEFSLIELDLLKFNLSIIAEDEDIEIFNKSETGVS
jgi:hypothetical protein